MHYINVAQSSRFATWLTETIKEDSVPDEELRELDELLAQKGWKVVTYYIIIRLN